MKKCEKPSSLFSVQIVNWSLHVSRNGLCLKWVVPNVVGAVPDPHRMALASSAFQPPQKPRYVL